MISEPETFWPPPAPELRRWRVRMGLLVVVPQASILVLALGVNAVWSTASGGFDFGRHAHFMGLMGAITTVVFGLLALVLSVLWPRDVARAIDTMKKRVVLEEGERALVLCPALFLEKGYRPGHLVVTDRRVLRVEWTAAGSRQSVIGRKDELATVELTDGRSTRNPLAAAYLRAMQTERGLTFTRRDGERTLVVTYGFVLDPLFAWFEKAGFATGFRNDADLWSAAPPTSPRWFENSIPGELRRRRRVHVLLVLAALAAGAVLVLAFPPRSPVLPPSVPVPPAKGGPSPAPPPPGAGCGVETLTLPGGSDFPTLSRTRELAWKNGKSFDVAASEIPPRGEESVVCIIEVEKRIAPGRLTVQRFALVRIGAAAILRQHFPGEFTPPATDEGYQVTTVEQWEPLGSPGDSDDVLLGKARDRLAAPGK